MNNPSLYINDDKILRLELLDTTHPTLVNLKADHWHLVYKIYHHKTLFDNGLFSNNYLICKQRQILIIEEYNISILDKNQIKTDDDIIKNLRLFDLINNKTGKFSKLSSGSFSLHKLDGNMYFTVNGTQIKLLNLK